MTKAHWQELSRIENVDIPAALRELDRENDRLRDALKYLLGGMMCGWCGQPFKKGVVAA